MSNAMRNAISWHVGQQYQKMMPGYSNKAFILDQIYVANQLDMTFWSLLLDLNFNCSFSYCQKSSQFILCQWCRKEYSTALCQQVTSHKTWMPEEFQTSWHTLSCYLDEINGKFSPLAPHFQPILFMHVNARKPESTTFKKWLNKDF